LPEGSVHLAFRGGVAALASAMGTSAIAKIPATSAEGKDRFIMTHHRMSATIGTRGWVCL